MCKHYLIDALDAHISGNEKKANALFVEGFNFYSQLLAKACSGNSKGDLPLLTAVLKVYYECSLEQCGDTGRALVDDLTTLSSGICIHN